MAATLGTPSAPAARSPADGPTEDEHREERDPDLRADER